MTAMLACVCVMPGRIPHARHALDLCNLPGPAPEVRPRPNMILTLGSFLQRLLQHSLRWPALLLPLKVLVHGLVLLLFKTTPLRRSALPVCTCSGLRLQGGPLRSVLNWVVFYRGEFEPTLTACLGAHLQAGDVCVDAGANAGYFSLLMAQHVGETGRVIAIEPAPGNQQRLRENLQLNDLQERVHLVLGACSDRQGALDFYVNTLNDMHCRLHLPSRSERDHWLMGGTRAWRKITACAAPLSHWVGPALCPGVRFVKLDVEGVEHLLVQDILAHFTHPGLMVALEAKAPHIAQTLRAFEEAGFWAYDLNNNYAWLFDRKARPMRAVTYDALYRRSFMVDVLLTRQALPSDASAQ